MDNNQPSFPPEGNPQPQNGPMPPDFNQPQMGPMDGQMGQPMNPQMGQPMMNQPMNGQPMPMGQPMMNQPYPQQPMMKPPKQPMDPAKKKKLILGLSIGGGVLVLAIVAAIVIPILLRVDYSSAYSTAKELKSKVYEIYHSYDCEYVIDYVDSAYTTSKKYSEYIEGCKSVYSSATDDLVSQLEATDGVKRNDEIKAQFGRFKTEYTSLSAGDSDALSAKLSLWQARHDFIVAADDLDNNSSDAEYTAAAKFLIDSGNDSLKTYGEGWLERRLAITAAYRAYRASTSDWSTLYSEYTNKTNEYRDWVAANKPDINTIASLNFDDTSKMYSEFTKLYNLIAETYAKNYNHGSGDCTEIFGEVICE